jgi:flagellar biosynthesis/type III secretory pathway chaperone
MKYDKLENFLKSLSEFDNSNIKSSGITTINIIIILELIDVAGEFLKVSKEIKTIVDFEEVFKNFRTNGFPYEKNPSSLLLIISSHETIKTFANNLKYFKILVNGWVNEEINKIYKTSSKNEIHEKYDSLFYQLEILNEAILNTENKLAIFIKTDDLDLEKLTNAKKNLDRIIYTCENPIDINTLFEEIITEDEDDSRNKIYIL